MYTIYKFILLCFLSLVCANAQYLQYPNTLKTTEVFFFSIHKYIFTDGLFLNRTDIKYRMSFYKLPDLPDWISFTYEPGGDSYLYGSIPQGFLHGNLDVSPEGLESKPDENRKRLTIQVIATNKLTYDIRTGAITLVVEERSVRAAFEVEMCFLNLNVEDMFQQNRFEQLIDIVKNNLWKIQDEIYPTLVASSVKMGGRVPPNPRDKEGVVVRIGSTANFSSELINLELEVSPLRVRNPCPKEYKRSSADMYFRTQHFHPDWCRFRLYYASSVIPEKNGPVQSPIQLTSDNFHPPEYVLEQRDLVPEFGLAVVAPIVTSFLVLIIVAFFLCCYREGIEKRNKESPSIQMVQYASIHRASNNLRSLATKREAVKSTAVTPTSTIQRSYGNSTLNKHQNTLTLNEGKSISNSTLPKDGSATNYAITVKSSL